MFLLRRILRIILLGYALYSFAYGIWLINQAEIACPAEFKDGYALRNSSTTTPETKSCDETANEYIAIGLRQAVIAVYEFIAAWRGDQASFSSIAVVRVLLYAVLNRVWMWGIGWPRVDDNLVLFAIAMEAAML
ncbi:hypothetical protein Q7P35_012214 [Cladosporium inversicolor]